MRLERVTAALLAAAVLLSPAAAAAQAVPITLAPGEVLLQVAAEGEHLARPDVVSVRAGVVTTGRTAKQALAANAELANRLLDAVRAAGVQPRDIRTSELSVSPQFAPERREGPDDEGLRTIVGYFARNTLSLRLRDLTKAPEIVDSLFAAGANEVRGPTFSLSDPAPATRAARQAAVAAAMLEADTYAEALGMKIARVLRVSERGDFRNEDGDTIVVTGSRTRSTPMEPGEIAITGRVWIDYALVPR
jgi:uncharacterized protein